MGTKRNQGKTSHRSSPPARLLENRENQLIEKAYNLVEERMDNGTATSQEIVHFLKMGTARAQLEKRSLRLKPSYWHLKKKPLIRQNEAMLNTKKL